jgi:hypothetical protein
MKRKPRPDLNVQAALPDSVPAPFGGLNTRDPVSAMALTDAVILDNWVAYPSEVKMRKGSALFAEKVDDPQNIESLLTYKSATGQAVLFAATATGVFNVTNGVWPGAAEFAATNARWQYTNTANSAGSFLIAVNGVDSMRRYNGTAWTTVPDFTAGFETNKIVNVEVYKERLFFVPKDELAFWYLPTGAVAGTALRFRLGQVCNRGGYLMAISHWTIDAGEGSDDHLAMITSEGEVIVYTGADPSDVENWRLVGVYYVGSPLSRRCTAKWSGEVYFLTERGVFPLSKVLATPDQTAALSDKIEPSIVRDAVTHMGDFGWEMVVHTREGIMLVNVPLEAQQYCVHLSGKGWSRFRGWNASCFAYFEGNLFYASGSAVYAAFTGGSDGEAAIVANVLPAFSVMRVRGKTKHVKMLRPIFQSNGPFGYVLGGCTDYQITEPSGAVATVPVEQSLWDSGEWDSAIWEAGDNYVMTKEWRTVANQPGFAFAPYIRVISSGVRASLIMIDYLLETGHSV